MHPQQTKTIQGHIDCDCFFVSCMVAKTPSLRGKVVCVGHDIIIARSYEAKSYGISVGTPVREAKKILPKDALFIAPSFGLYRYVSSRLMNFLDATVDSVNKFSIDEAFFQPLSHNPCEEYQYNTMKQMQAQIHAIIGIPVSIGIAPTNILAKIFSDKNKPYGICVALNETTINQYLQETALEDIPFVGQKTQEKLRPLCKTAYDFKQLSYEYIRSTLGFSGLKIRRGLNGYSIETTIASTGKQRKSIGRSYSFNPRFTCKKQEIWGHLMCNIERAVQQLRDQGHKTSMVSISFRTKSFESFKKEKQLMQPSNDRTTLIKQCRALFETIAWGSIMCRSTGVRFSQLTDSTHQQVSLFTDPIQHKHTQLLNDTIQTINAKYGKNIITSASDGKVL